MVVATPRCEQSARLANDVFVDDDRHATLRADETSIGDYIENFYNVERLQLTLDYVSPTEFEPKARVVMVAT